MINDLSIVGVELELIHQPVDGHGFTLLLHVGPKTSY